MTIGLYMNAYDEIMLALSYAWGDDEEPIPHDSIYEIIHQEHDPIETIATALDEYRAAASKT